MNNIDVITNIKVKHVLAKFSCIDSRPSEDFLDNAKNLEEIWLAKICYRLLCLKLHKIDV